MFFRIVFQYPGSYNQVLKHDITPQNLKIKTKCKVLKVWMTTVEFVKFAPTVTKMDKTLQLEEGAKSQVLFVLEFVKFAPEPLLFWICLIWVIIKRLKTLNSCREIIKEWCFIRVINTFETTEVLKVIAIF